MVLEGSGTMDEVPHVAVDYIPRHEERRPSMKRTIIVGASLVVLILIGSVAVMGGQMPLGSQGEQGQPMMGRGMMCPMMGGMMGGQMDPSEMMGMMSMMGGGQMDPKAMARMLQLRGDMLKVMGEVMLKHSQAMREGQ
jgi:hypothetical protein